MFKLCSYFDRKSNIIFKNTINFAKCDFTTKKRNHLKIAVIGQSMFAAEVLKLLSSRGHRVVGAFTIPDQGGRADPLASVATEYGTTVFKVKSWRDGKRTNQEVLNNYKQLEVDLNVLPFCSQFIPMEIIDYPLHRSICYHPSLLPRHRGVSSISWTLINGDKEAGFSIFWADDGLDTGPILLQESCAVEDNDTVDTLYRRFLYPRGIIAMATAVDMVADGTAMKTPQSEEGASFEPALRNKTLQKVGWDQSANSIHNFIRGLDSSPGAWSLLNNEEVRLFGSKLWKKNIPLGEEVIIDNCPTPGLIHSSGILLPGNDGKFVNVEKISVGGKMIEASKFGKAEESVNVELTEEEKKIIPVLNAIWKNILQIEILDGTDFFESGAGSMDVVRLIEEIKQKLNVELKNDNIYMAPVFSTFYKTVVLKMRLDSSPVEIKYEGIEKEINDLNLKFPTQLFVNGSFINSELGDTLDCINPTDESVICQVQCASKKDIDNAVAAAKEAFEGEWSKISSRDRSMLLFRLADLMHEHEEELATLESIDAGAVYSLALKTHVGMSVETWRYFAGWADKIHGSTIPITHARPNRNLTFTRKEPIGVCGLIIPWNYPLMMLSWKMAPCLAAGNTVVIKPAEFTPLSALKFAELTVKAGFPPGVVNVLPGKGSVAGAALAEHGGVGKVGFTGSTTVGKLIMQAGAKTNLKKVSLELGGKSPLVIFSDCDIAKSVRMSMGGVFFNKGENCIAAGRIFVESNIHDEFVDKVIEETKKIVIGDPLDRSTHHGPQNHYTHLQKLIQYCKIGVDEGAKLRLGGVRCDRPGYFFEPTIFTDVTDDMYIAKEEAFGPVMVISKFDSNEMGDLINRANDTKYGLACGIFTNDINRAMYFAEKIQAGTVFINTYNKTDVAAPFGGFKESGFGKDLGEEALNEYLRVKTVTVEYSKN